MNIRDMTYIIAVADEQHFGRAADRCNVSQPALSGQILKLEDYLGVQLFERTNRSVRVTPVGSDIVARARQLVMIAEDIITTADGARDPYSGSFRLGMISTIGPYLSPLILSSLREEMPNLSIALVEGITPILENKLAGGELDGVILATAATGPHMQEAFLYEEPFKIALPATHALAKTKKIDARQLQHENLLLLADGHCLRDQVLDVCHSAVESPESNTRETSLETILSLVAVGDGITLVPALASISFERHGDRITVCDEASGTARRTIRLVSRQSYTRMKLIEKITSVIRRSVPDEIVSIDVD